MINPPKLINWRGELRVKMVSLNCVSGSREEKEQNIEIILRRMIKAYCPLAKFSEEILDYFEQLLKHLKGSQEARKPTNDNIWKIFPLEIRGKTTDQKNIKSSTKFFCLKF